jgi:DNA-directed RNA polymerase subunit M/transcription elongation factor TFIIS
MKKVQIPSGEPAGRIACQQCGNANEFVEIAENVLVTTRYRQNSDGSFTPEESDTEIFGTVKFVCGVCGADLTRFHSHFLEMSF